MKNQTMTGKYAAYTGSKHMRIRVTAFFDTLKEAIDAGSKTLHTSTFACTCFNWREHMEWNRQRSGHYFDMPVTE